MALYAPHAYGHCSPCFLHVHLPVPALQLHLIIAINLMDAGRREVLNLSAPLFRHSLASLEAQHVQSDSLLFHKIAYSGVHQELQLAFHYTGKQKKTILPATQYCYSCC